MERVVESYGVDFQVEFDATPYRASTFYDPAEGGEVEITDVCLGGYSVIDHLAAHILNDIQQQLESVDFGYEEKACAAEDAAERRAEDARLEYM